MTTIDTDPASDSSIPTAKARLSVSTSSYPSDCKQILFAFLDLMEERGWSQAEAARQIKHGRHKRPLSSPALSQLLGGTYQANPETLCRAIAAAIDHARGRAMFGSSGFAPTRLYHALVELADVTVVTQRITCLHGGLLCGKTSAARYLSVDYHRAAVIFLTVPYADTYGGFVRRLTRVLGLSVKGSLSDLREAILASLDGSHLLVIDEFHQPLLSYTRHQALRVMEFIREINDTSECGILLVGSSAGHAVLTTTPEYDRFSAGIYSVDVCDPVHDLRPLATSDLAAIAKVFGLPNQADRLDSIRLVVTEHGVSRLFDLLRLASSTAEAENNRLTWDHVDAITSATLRLAA